MWWGAQHSCSTVLYSCTGLSLHGSDTQLACAAQAPQNSTPAPQYLPMCSKCTEVLASRAGGRGRRARLGQPLAARHLQHGQHGVRGERVDLPRSRALARAHCARQSWAWPPPHPTHVAQRRQAALHGKRAGHAGTGSSAEVKVPAWTCMRQPLHMAASLLARAHARTCTLNVFPVRCGSQVPTAAPRLATPPRRTRGRMRGAREGRRGGAQGASGPHRKLRRVLVADAVGHGLEIGGRRGHEGLPGAAAVCPAASGGPLT